jgi:HTH-type transcriptional regulator/antitoxin HigA
MPDLPPNEMLRFLMQENGLTQQGLPEIGSQGVVSEILSGKRKLNARQIANLASRFNVPESVFF